MSELKHADLLAFDMHLNSVDESGSSHVDVGSQIVLEYLQCEETAGVFESQYSGLDLWSVDQGNRPSVHEVKQLVHHTLYSCQQGEIGGLFVPDKKEDWLITAKTFGLTPWFWYVATYQHYYDLYRFDLDYIRSCERRYFSKAGECGRRIPLNVECDNIERFKVATISRP